MIVTFGWHIPLDGRDFDEVSQTIDEMSARMVRIKPFLLGCQVTRQGAGIGLTLRVSAHDRWRAAQVAKKAMVALCARTRLPWRESLMQSQAIEPNRRDLLEGQGRTVPPRPPRRAAI